MRVSSNFVFLAIITPTFNRSTLLLRLHNSLLEQKDYTLKWVHIIVDDHSDEKIDDSHFSVNDRWCYIRLESNSGPLTARNIGLRQAEQINATHVCFVDDDDYLMEATFKTIDRYLRMLPNECHFVFHSNKPVSVADVIWPSNWVIVSWIHDIVMKRRFGSDNFILLSMKVVRGLRFSELGRTQREWTFFAKLSRQWDRVVVCPESLLVHQYLPGGLTDEARLGRNSLMSIWNAVHRSFIYCTLSPLSINLGLNFLKQLALTPLRFFRLFLHWTRN